MRVIRPIPVNDAVLTSSNVPETDYGQWDYTATYMTGDYVIVISTHRIYQSVQDNNINNAPSSDVDSTWWLDVGATNKWRMFDDLVNAQTTNDDTIVVSLLVPSERADSVALLNVSAATVQITMTDPVEGLVFDQTYDMTSDSGIVDWYDYFFEPVARKTELAMSDLLPYPNATITITLTDVDEVVACGECIFGLSRELGGAQYGAKVGIQDYSVKTTDDFGNYTILERAFSKRGSYTLWVEGSFISELQTLLASYRATPVVYIGADDIDATIIYGFYKDFEIDIAYAAVSLCSIEIEGLT